MGLGAAAGRPVRRNSRSLHQVLCLVSCVLPRHFTYTQHATRSGYEISYDPLSVNKAGDDMLVRNFLCGLKSCLHSTGSPETRGPET